MGPNPPGFLTPPGDPWAPFCYPRFYFMDHEIVPAAGILGTRFNRTGIWLPTSQRDMNIQDVLVFQNPVKGGHLVIDKHMEKKIGPVFRGTQTRKPQQQFLNGDPGFQFQN